MHVVVMSPQLACVPASTESERKRIHSVISWSPPAARPSSFRRNVTSQHPLRSAKNAIPRQKTTSRRNSRRKMSADLHSPKSLRAKIQNGRLDGFGRCVSHRVQSYLRFEAVTSNGLCLPMQRKRLGAA